MVKIGRCNEGNIIGHDLEIEKKEAEQTLNVGKWRNEN